MDKRWLPIGTFFLGVLVTVGAYEAVRALNRTADAWSNASAQMASEFEEDAAADRRTAALPSRQQQPRRRVMEPEARQDAGPQRRAPQRVDALPPNLRNAQAMNERERRRQQIRERLEAMSPEEREALRQRRMERRKRKIERLREARAAQLGEVPMDEPLDEAVDTGL